MRVPGITILARMGFIVAAVLLATPAESSEERWNWYFASLSRDKSDNPLVVIWGTATVSLYHSSIRIQFKIESSPKKQINFVSDGFSKNKVTFLGGLKGMSSGEGPEIEAWLGEYREMVDVVVRRRTGVTCVRREIVLRPAIGKPYEVRPAKGVQVVPDGDVIVLVAQQVGRCGELT